MGFSQTEINLRRLLNAAPRQQNHAKLIHYIATLRELLEQLVEETTLEGLPRISKAMVNDYSEKIEALSAKLAAPLSDDMPGSLDVDINGDEQAPLKTKEQKQVPSPILRRRLVSHPKVEEVNHDIIEADPSKLVKLDAASQTHIEKHRKLQEDLTDEMVGLARQLKESSLMMNQSLQDTEKLLDSTEKAVEHSLASTGAMLMHEQWRYVTGVLGCCTYRLS
ncbi:Membrane fusion protein use1 [Thalictrum thalictroides]|uniref:Membrane fusion protein use1 n=1 Tax=Thalictrum thalictroides TaxID=46969 RepID=A0A7J6W5W8_THATH|nr:Membrane fusion protein use1 [Thalictrum thalictroides]